MGKDEIIDSILRKCAGESGYFPGLSELIDMIAGYEVSDLEKDAIRQEITANRLLDEVPAGWGANTKTRQICESGGYVKYKTNYEAKIKLREKGQDSRDRLDIFYLKTKWLPYIVSIFALRVSVLAFLHSIGVLHWFMR